MFNILKWCWFSRWVVSSSCDPMDCRPLDLCPWDFPGKNTGVGCHFFLQGIFRTQESNLGLLHCKWILYHWGIGEAIRPHSNDFILSQLPYPNIVTFLQRVRTWTSEFWMNRKPRQTCSCLMIMIKMIWNHFLMNLLFSFSSPNITSLSVHDV